MDYISRLPVELVAYLCIFLDEADISYLFSTNSYYNNLFQKHKKYICRLRPITIIRKYECVGVGNETGIKLVNTTYRYGRYIKYVEYLSFNNICIGYADNNDFIYKIRLMSGNKSNMVITDFIRTEYGYDAITYLNDDARNLSVVRVGLVGTDIVYGEITYMDITNNTRIYTFECCINANQYRNIIFTNEEIPIISMPPEIHDYRQVIVSNISDNNIFIKVAFEVVIKPDTIYKLIKNNHIIHKI